MHSQLTALPCLAMAYKLKRKSQAPRDLYHRLTTNIDLEEMVDKGTK